LTSIRRHGWSAWGEWPVCHSFVFFVKPTGRTVRQIWNNEGSKRVVPRKKVPFGGSERCTPKFSGSNTETTNYVGVNRTFKPERQKIRILITWKLLSRSWRNFYRCTHHEWAFVGGPVAYQQIQYGGRRPSWILGKCQYPRIGLDGLEHSDSRFESIRRFVLGESIRFVKKSAIRFGRCIRLINDHTPIVPYSAVLYNSALLSCYNWRHSRREVVRMTHDDGVELTSFDNIRYSRS